jgi:DNA-nicking Smr family endonuclease
MRRRNLTPEEKALWRKAMRGVAPIQRAQADPLLGAPLSGIKKPVKTQPPPVAGNPLPMNRGFRSDPAAFTGDHDSFRAGDPRLDRHVRRGRMGIDAVLDLHGHTQLSARTTLLAFLTTAHAQGRRCVLVITGKGGLGAGKLGEHLLGRGVLRARMRDWLKEGAFRALVTRASPAHQKHGGGGAFYVFLKPPRRQK